MPEFAYKALSATGRRTRGSLVAASESAAIDRLSADGLSVTEIAPAEAGGPRGDAADGGHARFTLRRGVSSGEMILFIRRLATLVGSGIPLLQSIKAIAGQVESPVLHEALEGVRDDVQQGVAFSRALAKRPRIFPEMMVAMVRVGETGGILQSVLEELADFSERDQEMRGEVRVALAYPCLVLLLAGATLVFLMTTAVPRLAAMFEGIRVDLPAPTIALMWMSDTMRSRYSLVAFALLAVALVASRQWLHTPGGRRAWDRFCLRAPLLGSLARRAAIARFSRSLGALVRGGVPVMEGLEVVKRVMNNSLLTEAVERTRARVHKGESMARGLTDEDLFPEMVRYMIASGEESGHLDEMLLRIADVYERETRNAVKVLVGILAPLMILVVAGAVGFIAMAMLLPIFRLNQMM